MRAEIGARLKNKKSPLREEMLNKKIECMPHIFLSFPDSRIVCVHDSTI